jgi:hypothetical protein
MRNCTLNLKRFGAGVPMLPPLFINFFLHNQKLLTFKNLKPMSPKEKARELFYTFADVEGLMPKQAKQCCVIAVNEILKILIPFTEAYTYFEDVQKEIKNL